jgi:hypothetical protein
MNRELLAQPFDRSQIKQREGAFGDQLDYVEGATVIQRLNDALEGDWAFEVVEHQIHEHEVLVLGKLSHEGIVKMQFGKSAITRTRTTNALVSLGDDLKAAATDALKKCATLFGVGLHLYFDEAPASSVSTGDPVPPPPARPAMPENGNGRLSTRQLSAIFAIARAKNMRNQDVRAYTKEVFNKLPDFLTRQEASLIIQQLQGEGTHGDA